MKRGIEIARDHFAAGMAELRRAQGLLFSEPLTLAKRDLIKERLAEALKSIMAATLHAGVAETEAPYIPPPKPRLVATAPSEGRDAELIEFPRRRRRRPF